MSSTATGSLPSIALSAPRAFSAISLIRYVFVFARKRASAYYGEVYYVVMVEEKEPA